MDRNARLRKLFFAVLDGTTPISPHSGPQFLEALYTQPDPTVTIGKLVSSKEGMSALTTAMRYNLSPQFFNTHGSSIIHYLESPDLKAINNGDFLENILIKFVDPPIFWVEFRKSFLKGELDEKATNSFAWLLLRLCTLRSEQSTRYREDNDMARILANLLSSTVPTTKDIGLKIEDSLKTSLPVGSHSPDSIQGGSEPGGRHDNDFSDFRKISILPTGDEIQSKKMPFLRPSSILEDPETQSSRVAIHLDNQFRLLREDMLYEMREELQIALGNKNGRHRGTQVHGLRVIGLECGDDKKRIPWGIVCVCKEDFREMKELDKIKDRRDFLENKRQFFKHQSMTCLVVNKEIIAFPCIHRDEQRLAKNPPEVVLQFDDAQSTQKALWKLKMENIDVTLIQIDTAMFAYEPILKGLQQAKTLPLSRELLLWKQGDLLDEVPGNIPPVVHALRNDFHTNLKTILNTTADIILDASQARSLISGLTQKVSLIQGPPGTGKSFIGALMAKAIHDLTERSILVVCYTNHALDDILTSLLAIGIPQTSMLRLGGKSTAKTECLSIQKQDRGPATSQIEWIAIDELKSHFRHLRDCLQRSFNQYTSSPSFSNILDFLEMEYPDYFDAFQLPDLEDGMTMIGGQGKAAQKDYLISKWVQGEALGQAGLGFKNAIESSTSRKEIWNLARPDRSARLNSWRKELTKEAIEVLATDAKEYNLCLQRLNRAYGTRIANILRSKRIVGCTTTAAAKYCEEIQTFNPDVLLVEEAGEILESHVLTALGPETSQLILIGDHKQLRPKVNNYSLTVENGQGYDLNRSLFERLVLKDYPHEALSQQHRMRPEISALIRSLTYPELIDAPQTQNRPNLRGIQDNIVFIQHESPEDEHKALSDKTDIASTSSKQNSFEASMVLKIVKYLAQQGYGTEDLVVLTPYLGQLHKLRELLKKDNDPILNDLDNNELVKAGLLDPATAKLNKRQIRLATIDNYQGEESDIVIVSLTRSNPKCDIGFMFAPERLNVLLSRARNAMIILGNASTFTNAKKGKELWKKFFDLLVLGNHIYRGLPVKCENHPDTISVLSEPEKFEIYCPDGGCVLPCAVPLSCGLHVCPSKCHQLSDHSKISCKEKVASKCPDGHLQTWQCGGGRPAVCDKCERAKKLARKKQQDELEAQTRRDAEQKAHLEKMDALNAQIDLERQSQEDARLTRERVNAIKQKQSDLDSIRASARTNVASSSRSSAIENPSTTTTTMNPISAAAQPGSGQTLPKTNDSTFQGGGTPPGISTSTTSTSPSFTSFLKKLWTGTPEAASQQPTSPREKPFKKVMESPSQNEWNRQKNFEGAQSDAIDSIMDMIGLEIVKEKILSIKAKIDTNIRQGVTLKHERFNVVLLGNPGTGKTTIARHYASFLAHVKAIPGKIFEETTGARLAQNGVSAAEKLIDSVVKGGGGAIFIDEAYQLTNGHNHGGPAVLDFLLAEMENRVGTLVFILAGYSKEMEKFFEHNPGLRSRVPSELKFSDYKDEEFMWMFEDLVKKTFGGKMAIEGGTDGLFVRIVIRRLGRRRESPGFGNARDLQTIFSQIRERQAIRLNKARRRGEFADDFFLTREDLIGPQPSAAIQESKEWETLQKMIGLKAVKDSVKGLFNLIEMNFGRELSEQEVLDLSLNKVFLGSPGTGKTTVAKLYGKILADIGLLSNGEVVVKNPSDFIGNVIGASEANTKAILASTVGKVLIIDEAYMLYGGGGSHDGSNSSSNQFKTSVIDTIVAEVQSTPGEDRCVILVGYKDQMIEMFQNVNPGLSRRFKIEDAFNFEDFNDDDLLEILELKLKQQDLAATDEAKKTAIRNLSRLRNRPNFGNAGEVENIITRAKVLAVARTMKLPQAERASQIVFEAEDIDPDHNRIAKASQELEKLFSDIVGCDDIVERLKNYQEIVQVCKDRDCDPRERVPTNFVFTGPPGTGKTTVARKIGQVYYNMGILASPEVIESSASDLVGQYVGHTGPKTKKLFQKALGKVLFIDEAYRLSSGHFAQEAIDELVGLLTHPDFKGKLIIVLAGYEKDMNQLMSVNTGLSSRFPDQVVFSNLDAESCLKVIGNELQKNKIDTDGWESDKSSPVNIEMVELIRDMAELKDWGNARDMVNASKEMINRALLSSKTSDPKKAPVLTGDDALLVMRKMISDRKNRTSTPAKPRRTQPELPQQTSTNELPPDILSTTESTAKKEPSAKARSSTRGMTKSTHSPKEGQGPSELQDGAQRSTSNIPPSRHNHGRGAHSRHRTRAETQRGGSTGVQGEENDVSGPSNVSEEVRGSVGAQKGQSGKVQRDPGVSDAIWRQLEAAKRAAAEIERDARNRIRELERQAKQKKEEEQRQKQLADKLAKDEAAAKEAAQRAELQRQKEEARIKALAARAAKEKAEAELRAKREAERLRQEKEKQVQQKLREMGVCPVGFRWIKMGSYYRCEGGAHTVSVDQINL